MLFNLPETEKNEQNSIDSLSDYENPYPEIATHRKHKLNKTWSCSCLHLETKNEEEAEYESDHEGKEEKQEGKKITGKEKGKKKQARNAKGKATARNKPNNTKPPKTAPKPQPEKKPPEPSTSKKKFNITPSVPELARTEPELLKEQVILVRDMKVGEFCKNKITMNLVSIAEIAGSLPAPQEEVKPPEIKPSTEGKTGKGKGKGHISKAPSKNVKPVEEEVKLTGIQAVIRDELIDKLQASMYVESPLQIETENEELIKWVDSKETKTTDAVYWCKLCNAYLNPEVVISHYKGKSHEEVVEKSLENDVFHDHILRVTIIPRSESNANEVLNQKAKLLKRKAKKLKQRLEVTALPHETATHAIKDTSSLSTSRQRIQRLCIDLDKQVNPYIKDYDLLEIRLKEILKIIDQRVDVDLQLLRNMKCIHMLVEVCKRVFCCPKGELKCLGQVLDLIMKIISGFTTLRENRIYLLTTNKLVILVELLMWCLVNINTKFIVGIPFLPTLLQILTVHIKQKVEHEQFKHKDPFIQYIYCYGVLSKLKSKVFQVVNGPLDLTDSKNVVPSVLLSSIMFVESLTMYTSIEPRISRAVFEKPSKEAEDAQFVMKQTELYGVVHLLSKLLLSKGPFRESNSAILPYTIQTLILMSMKILNNSCRIDLVEVQGIFKVSYYYEQIYHLLNYLLQYSNENVDNSKEVRELLHETILFCGYIALMNTELQTLFSKGEVTLVQKLSNLPIHYFQDKKMKDILFPTLVSVVHNNKRNFLILEKELDTRLIADYLKVWINTKEEDTLQGNLSISGTSSVFDMLQGNSPFICFSKRVPRKVWEEVLAACELLKKP